MACFMLFREDVVAEVLEARSVEIESPKSQVEPDSVHSQSESASDNDTDVVNDNSVASQPKQHFQSLPDELLRLDKPLQPPAESIPSQVLKARTLHFQAEWFQKYPWLHYSTSLNRVVCYTCAKAEVLQLINLANKREPAFISTGFCNWKKGLQYFRQHELSQSHQFSVLQMDRILSGHQNIDSQLSSQVESEQAKARSCLKVIFTTIQYLARQGLAFRGHENFDGNFKQLLYLRAADNPDLKQWLERRNDMTSGSRQNEILDLYSHDIIRRISALAVSSGSYSLVVDGTQDVSGSEQESICVRYIDSDLNAREEFLGFYEPPDTRGETIAKCITDSLLRLQLPISLLRGQTYDGAANMSGCYKGCQAAIAVQQPLALFVHCGAHCINLVAQKTCSAVAVTRDAISVVQELGSLFSSSLTCRSAFSRIRQDSDNETSYRKIKPLCPTRWLVRVDAIRAVLQQHKQILETLFEIAQSSSHVSSRANGLYDKLNKSVTLTGLEIAVTVLGPLEVLNRKLQSKTETVAGMLECAQAVSDELQQLRSETTFASILQKCSVTADKLGLKPLHIPRPRKPPTRFAGPAVAYSATTPDDFYRPQYFEMIDTATSEIAERFNGSVGLQTYMKLENTLLTGNTDKELLANYPEININDLEVQLAMFRRKHPVSKLSEAVTVIRDMSADVRSMFDEIEKLMRLLLVCPCSSAEAERSFSSLRRLKTWLRSTMSQKRLNSVAVCHTHQELLDETDITKLMRYFVNEIDTRVHVFGRI